MRWEERWPPDRRIAYLRDEMPEEYIRLMFEVMMRECGGFA